MQRAYLNGSISHADMVDDTPLNGEGGQAQGVALLSQIVQAGIGISIIGLACNVGQPNISIASNSKSSPAYLQQAAMHILWKAAQKSPSPGWRGMKRLMSRCHTFISCAGDDKG